MTKSRLSSQRGFTLIELLTVVGTIGVLAGLSIVSFGVYRSRAAYTAAVYQIKNVKTVLDASLIQPDVTFGAVPATDITTPGPIADPAVHALLPEVNVGANIKLSVEYDPTCSGGQSEFLEVKHCKGEEYVQWFRACDGVDQWVEHITGTGCS